jgi:hypothetical protein
LLHGEKDFGALQQRGEAHQKDCKVSN